MKMHILCDFNIIGNGNFLFCKSICIDWREAYLIKGDPKMGK